MVSSWSIEGTKQNKIIVANHIGFGIFFFDGSIHHSIIDIINVTDVMAMMISHTQNIEEKCVYSFFVFVCC